MCNFYVVPVHQTVVSRCLKEVTTAMVTHLMGTWINFPQTLQGRTRIKDRSVYQIPIK